MFTIDKAKTVEFGKILKQYRTKNNYTFRDIHALTGIDSSTISRLEDGKILRINSLVVTALAELFCVNPLIFLNIIGYVQDKDVFNYCKIVKTEKSFYENSFIEILDSFSISSDSEIHLKEFMNLPFLDKQDKAFKKDDFIFVYNNKNELLQEDLGIFSYNNSILVGFYYSNENTVSLYDYFTKKISIHSKSDIKIIGRIVTIIDYGLYNK